MSPLDIEPLMDVIVVKAVSARLHRRGRVIVAIDGRSGVWRFRLGVQLETHRHFAALVGLERDGHKVDWGRGDTEPTMPALRRHIERLVRRSPLKDPISIEGVLGE